MDVRKHALMMRHLSTCADCRLRFAEEERLNSALNAAFDLRLEPPDALADRVMSSLRREPFRPTPISVNPKFRLLRNARWLAAPLVGSLALAFGFRWRAYPIASRLALPQDARAIADLDASRTFAKPFDPAPAGAMTKRSDAHAGAISKRDGAYDWTSPREHVEAPPRVKADRASRKLDPPHPLIIDARSESADRNAAPDLKRRVRSPRRDPASRHRDASPPAIVAAKTEANEAFADAASPRLQKVSGSALVRSDDTDWSQAMPDATVRLDQRLRSGRDSQALLTLGKIELRMNAETELIPIRTPGSASPYWVVRLVHGEVFIKAPKGERGLKTLTAAGDVISKEGEYIVRADDLFETRLMIAKGSATLENDLGRSSGLRNMQIASRLGFAPELAQPIIDSDAFRWAYAPFQLQDLLLRPNEP